MKKAGGPAFPQCSRCGEQAVRRQGHQWLCAMHYRFGQMRANAKRHGKPVLSHEDLHVMSGSNLDCPDCGRKMNWLSEDGMCSVASLQHYRNGTMAIVCRSCNTRHAYMPNDSYQELGKDHKWCPKCKTAKSLNEFSADNSRSGQIKVKSWCKLCAGEAHADWQRRNREHYNQKQRERRVAKNG